MLCKCIAFLVNFFVKCSCEISHFVIVSCANKFFGLPGTAVFLSENPELLKMKMTPSGKEDDACNKDTGEKQKSLQKWWRGLLHYVRSGGHIDRCTSKYVVYREMNIPLTYHKLIVTFMTACLWRIHPPCILSILGTSAYNWSIGITCHLHFYLIIQTMAVGLFDC